MFLLADVQSMYVSVHQIFEPSLNQVPVVVLSNNDGCVVALCAKSKSIGIRRGDPLFKIKDLVRIHTVTVLSSQYALYADLSARLMRCLSTFSPDVEVYSIDEAFLGLEGFTAYDLTAYGRCIKDTVKQNTGLPINIGIAPTKTLAKIANRLAKKEPANAGVLYLATKAEQEEALKKVAVEDVWGIGRQYAQKLQNAGITTAYQLSCQPVEWARKHLGGIVGMRLVQELRGISCIQLELFPSIKQSIASTKSFGKPIRDFWELSEAVATYTTRAAEKLRQQQSCVNVITVFIHTSPFADGQNYYANSASFTLPTASDDTGELIHYANCILRRIFQSGHSFKKAGVIFTNLVQRDRVQTNLFETRDRVRSKKAMDALDAINTKLGSGKVSFAAAGIEKPWKMKAAYQSPRYTTRWDELMTASI